MKPIYIDKNGNSQKLVSGSDIYGNAVYADYTKSDIGVAGSAVEFQHNGINYRMRFVEMVVTLNEDYVTRFINQIKDFNGKWIDFGDIIAAKAKNEFYRWNNLASPSTFGKLELNPLDENGNLKAGLVNEIQFFQAHVGCGQNGIAIPLFDIFIDSILTRLPEGAT